MAKGKHYRSGSAPASQSRRVADENLYNYRVDPQPEVKPVRITPIDDDGYPAQRRARSPQNARRTPSSRSGKASTPAKKAKKSPFIPLLAVFLLLAAVGIVGYILWDMGAVSLLLGMLG